MGFIPLEPGHRKEFLKISVGNRKNVRAGIFIFDFKDHEHHVAYAPSLNLSAYGDTPEEATNRLEMVLDDFFDNLLVLPPHTINLELEKLGWKQSRYFKKQFAQTAYVDRDGVLKNFNLSEDTKISSKFVAV